MCFFSELQRVMYHWIFCIAPLQTSEIQSYSELSVHLFTGITVKMVLRSFTSIWKLFRFCRWISQMPSSSSHMDRSTWSQLGTSEPRRHMIVPAQCKVHHMINETDFLHMGFLQCLAAQCRPTLSLDLPKWRCGWKLSGVHQELPDPDPLCMHSPAFVGAIPCMTGRSLLSNVIWRPQPWHRVCVGTLEEMEMW